MIFVAAGTKDGRELADFLQSHGFAVTASAVTEYGGELLKKNPALAVNNKPLDTAGLIAYLREINATAIIDATHPYAKNASQNAIAAGKALALPYMRYERPAAAVTYENVCCVADYAAAAAKCAAMPWQNIFLTTGSNNLKIFADALPNKRLIARVLPSAKIIAECLALGLTPADIIAMQGPFSQKLNEEMFRCVNADVIITKNSGALGGTDTKTAAAAALNLPVVMIERPQIDYPAVASSNEEVLKFLTAVVQRQE